MARIRNPLLPTSDGSLSSSGFSVAPADDGIGGGVASGLAAGLAGLVKAATYDKDLDPRVQQAGYYKVKTAGEQATLDAQSKIADIIAGFQQMTPEEQQRVTREVVAAGSRGGIKPSDLAATVLAVVAPSGNEDMIRRGRAAGGGAPLGPDQSFTVDAQESIRRDNERMADEDRLVTEGGLNSRNAATIAGAMDRERLQESGRMARRFDAPANTPAGTRTTFSPEDPRGKGGPVDGAPTPSTVTGSIMQSMVNGQPVNDDARAMAFAQTGVARNVHKADRVKELLPKQTTAGVFDPVDDEVEAQLQLGKDDKTSDIIDPQAYARLRARAVEIYSDNPNGNLPSAVKQAMDETLEPSGDKTGWFGTGRAKLRGRQTPTGAGSPGATPAPAGIAEGQLVVQGGKRYRNRGGVMVEE